MRRLRDFPLIAPPRESVIAPLEIEGLPAGIAALGRGWERKVEFHVTVLARAVIEELGEGDPEFWEVVAVMLAGRKVGPIYVTPEVRRVRHPDKPELETIVAMLECPVLEGLFEELSWAFEANLLPPPTHVTLYSTDPEHGIGIMDEDQLQKRAPALSEEKQQEVREAMRFDAVFGAET